MKPGLAQNIIGEQIIEVRAMSFFVKSALKNKYIVLYIKISDAWYSLTTSDGRSKIEKLNSEPAIISLHEIPDEFAYPVAIISDKHLIGKITDIKEYLWQGREDESIGFYIKFEDGRECSVIEENETINILTGPINHLDKNFTLHSVY